MVQDELLIEQLNQKQVGAFKILFDRFYRGKNTSSSGYGIGLALCKMIITQQGGSIIAKNHPEGGALFVIRFPK